MVTSKTKHDANGQPYTVYKDMPSEVANKVLASVFLTPYVDEIEEMHPVPIPNEIGLELLPPGFQDGIYIFSFDL